MPSTVGVLSIISGPDPLTSSPPMNGSINRDRYHKRVIFVTEASCTETVTASSGHHMMLADAQESHEHMNTL